jgi:hypothetical protein
MVLTILLVLLLPRRSRTADSGHEQSAGRDWLQPVAMPSPIRQAPQPDQREEQ